jgi:hypothetical protein
MSEHVVVVVMDDKGENMFRYSVGRDGEPVTDLPQVDPSGIERYAVMQALEDAITTLEEVRSGDG